MANNDVRRQVDQALSRFVDEVMAVFVTGLSGKAATARLPALPKGASKPAVARARVGRRGPKSTPADVKLLVDRIMGVLGKAPAPMSAAELHAVIKGDLGQFNYALGKLKVAGEVTQFGARRMARYQVKAAVKPPVKPPAKGRKAGRARAAVKA